MSEASSESLSSAERRLVVFLRLVALLDLLALAGVVMPSETMAAVHEALGLGTFPKAPIVGYLARSTSLLYAGNGVLFALLSTDVRRYAPLIHALGWLLLALAGALGAIDVLHQMPTWWIRGEFTCVLSLAVLLLALERAARRA